MEGKYICNKVYTPTSYTLVLDIVIVDLAVALPKAKFIHKKIKGVLKLSKDLAMKGVMGQ